jgi:hypothetical protein
MEDGFSLPWKSPFVNLLHKKEDFTERQVLFHFFKGVFRSWEYSSMVESILSMHVVPGSISSTTHTHKHTNTHTHTHTHTHTSLITGKIQQLNEHTKAILKWISE